MNKPQTQTTSSLVPLIIDTNIFINCLSNNVQLRDEMRRFILQLSEIKYLLSYNHITYYECVKTVLPSRHQEFIDLLNLFHCYLIDAQDLQISAELHNVYNFYSKNGGKDIMSMSMSTEDILIAGTSLLAGGHVLTQNIKDFPAPFFREVYRQYIQYEERNIPKILVVYVLVPDVPFIVDANNECFGLKKPNLKNKNKEKMKKK